VAAIQQLQPTNPKKQPNFKTQPKKLTKQKESYRKSHNNNQLETVDLQKFSQEEQFSSSKELGLFTILCKD
jgi:hypothetical protein